MVRTPRVHFCSIGVYIGAPNTVLRYTTGGGGEDLSHKAYARQRTFSETNFVSVHGGAFAAFYVRTWLCSVCTYTVYYTSHVWLSGTMHVRGVCAV